MPRKKSTVGATERFDGATQEILDFAVAAKENLGDAHISHAFDHAIIRLYREFETLMLDALVAGINNDTSTLSAQTGIAFPRVWICY